MYHNVLYIAIARYGFACSHHETKMVNLWFNNICTMDPEFTMVFTWFHPALPHAPLAGRQCRGAPLRSLAADQAERSEKGAQLRGEWLGEWVI